MENPLCAPDEPGFRLIETFGYRPGEGIIRRDLHMARMARSAKQLGMAFDRAKTAELMASIRGADTLRCRLTLDISGRFDLVTVPVTLDVQEPWRLCIAEKRLDCGDLWLRHKTTRRALYDQTRADMPGEIDEVIFLNQRGELCEGTITNVFLKTTDGRLKTAPVESGVLPGILRQSLLESGQCQEAVLTASDIQNAAEIYVGNSLRGLIRAELA